MTGPYGEDLAFIHDAGFGEIAEAAADVLRAELDAAGVTDGLIADLGCGSGILSQAMAGLGFRVLGVDLSPDAIALARARVPGGTFREGSLLDARLPPCVAVASVGECINYLFDENHSGDAVRALFARVAPALPVGGVFLFDAAARGRLPEPGCRQVHVRGDGWVVMVEEEEDEKRTTLTRILTTFRADGEGRYRRAEETHRLRLLPRERVEGWLREAGFEVETGAAYGSRELPPGVVTYLARRAAG